MESHPMRVELFFADGRTGITKLIIVFAILQMPLKIGIEGSVLARISAYDKRENNAQNLRDSGTWKIAWMLKELLIATYVSPANTLCGLVLILND